MARRVFLAARINAWEVIGDVIGADRVLEIRKGALGKFLLQFIGAGDNVSERRVAINGPRLKYIDEVLADGRVHPGDADAHQKDDEKDSPNVIAIHEEVMIRKKTRQCVRLSPRQRT